MERSSRLTLVVLALLFSSPIARPQEPTRIPASEAMRHLLTSVKPEYPSLAETAHIQGRIVLTVMISPEGNVTDARAVMGHPMLLPPALTAVKQWKYRPFVVGGTAVAVSTLVHFLYTSGPEAELRENYLLQEIECTDLLQASHYDQAAASCNDALLTARKMSSNFLSFQTNAYRNAGRAALHLKRTSEAIEDFQESVKLIKGDPLSASLAFDTYHDLALALQADGQNDQAESEYREAEKALGARGESQKTGLNKQLSQTLKEHAALLRQMGRSVEADDLEQRARSLAPSN